MKRSHLPPILLACAAFLFLTGSALAAEQSPPGIQVAILLDTSSSMSGLIDQAKTQLWKIVNEFITARKDGEPIQMEVALFEYGNSRLSAETGWIRLILPLTDDLDRVSQELFALKTGGGAEYCGYVIKDAVEKLKWSASSSDLKVILIAGNEPFTQGPVNYADSCKAAIGKGIIVNTIHCGDLQTGINTKWKDGALLADGTYMHIDHNRAIADVVAPQDKEIARLGQELNGTYVPYGKQGKAGLANQTAQDRNAAGVSNDANIQRALTKASGLYNNDRWDLVDAVANEQVKLEEVKTEDLPEAMQGMSMEERKAHLEANRKKRADIQGQIAQLSVARQAYVQKELAKRSESGEADTFDAAMIRALRQQASQRDFTFTPPATQPAPAAE
jgi:hypothetical protein